MKSLPAAAALLCACALAQFEAFAQDDNEIVVAVIDFDNTSGQNLPDIGRVAHDVLNTYLVGLPGVSVVTRDKLSAVLKEQEMAAAGLVGNSALSTQMAQLLGADYMITGSVVQYSTDRRAFNSYGMNTVTIFHRMKISLQVIDLQKARLSFARTYDVEYKDTLSSASRGSSLDGRERDLLAQLVDQASPDLQKAIVAHTDAGKQGGPIKVPVATDPSGADIELNGVYIGSTPAEVELEEGIQVLRLVLQGYRVWEKKIKVTAGLKVSVALAPLPPEEKITIETKTGR